jgi:hypothetical protein
MMETKIGVMCQEPRNADCLKKLERARNGFSLEPPEGTQPLF